MSSRFTVITLTEPEPAALAWAVAQINPDLILVIDPDAEQWEVYAEDGTTPLFTVDLPVYVQVPGEIRRLFGSDAGFDFTPLGGEPPTYWQDVHVAAETGEPDHWAEAESAAARFAQMAAHLGTGTAVDHTPDCRHLGEPDQLLRSEWKA